MIYPPSPRTSRPGPSLPALFLIPCPSDGHRKNICRPPEPVRCSTVAGKKPCDSSSRASAAGPSGKSTSRTKQPVTGPVGMPMEASGCLPHHLRIWSGSMVAALNPVGTKGRLSMEQGKTGLPLAAYLRACSSMLTATGARSGIGGKARVAVIARPQPGRWWPARRRT